MDKAKLIEDIRTFNVAGFRARLAKLHGLIARRVVLSARKITGAKRDLQDIPVIINSRDRYSCLLLLIKWLERAGMKRIYIVDNDSTYPPLLEYFKTTPHKVFRLGVNAGHLALWNSPVYQMFRSDYYIYTDPDILPSDECLDDFLPRLMKCLEENPRIEKAGFALRIDDLPDHYRDKQKVLDWEKQFWRRQVAEDVFDAAIDTTFALYRPFTNGALWAAPAYRLAGKYVARHLPWYADSRNPTEEDEYYRQHIKTNASHWIKGG